MTNNYSSTAVVQQVLFFSDTEPDVRRYNDRGVGEYGAGDYFAYGESSCLIGKALEGILYADDIVALQSYLKNKRASAVLRELDFSVNDSDARWLDLVQRRFDQNYTHQESVQFADLVLVRPL